MDSKVKNVKTVNAKLIIKELEESSNSDLEINVNKWSEWLSLMLEDDQRSAFKFVLALLDSGEPPKRIIFDGLTPILKAISSCLSFEASQSTNCQSMCHLAMQVLYSLLQHPLNLEEILSKSLEKRLLLKNIYEKLLRLVTSEALSHDCNLIMSTSLILLIQHVCNSSPAAHFIKMFLKSCKHSDKNEINSCVKNEINEDGYCSCNLGCDEYKQIYLLLKSCEPRYTSLLFLYGLCNSQISWLFDHKCELPNQKECSRSKFTIHLFFPINKLCLSLSSYAYQAFQVLFIWCQCIRKLNNQMLNMEDSIECVDDQTRKKVPLNDNLFSIVENGEYTLFTLLNSSWESPAKGVSGTVYQCMNELLHLHENTVAGQGFYLADHLLKSLMTSPVWSLKGTYLPLELLISYIGVNKVLKLYPNLPTLLVTTLSVNHLAPVGANVYKKILQNITEEIWINFFMEIFLQYLNHSDRLTQHSMITMWLPPTLKRFPSLYLRLFEKIQLQSHSNYAQISLLRITRSVNPFDLNTESSKVLHCLDVCLKDNDDNTRVETLAFLCITHKTLEPPGEFEIEKLKQFFKFNINVDNTSFRHRAMRCFKLLIIRVRDTCANEIKKSRKNKTDCNSSSALLLKNCDFLIWLVHFFHKNFVADSNYQRRILSLMLYEEILLSFFCVQNGFVRSMDQKSEDVSSFVEKYSQDYVFNDDLCLPTKVPLKRFLFPWTYELLLNTVMDEMSDIKEKSENILELLTLSGETENVDIIHWFNKGLALCKSPKMSATESGAAIVKIMTASSKNCSLDMKLENGTQYTVYNITMYLLDEVEEQFTKVKENLLVASSCSPVHGTLLAFTRCFTEESTAYELENHVKEIIPKLVNLLLSLTEFVLIKLSCASSDSQCAPSFGEMGESIENIIQECEDKLDGNLIEEVTDSSFLLDDDLQDDVNLISSKYQLILACCWQTLRICCKCVSSIVDKWSTLMSKSLLDDVLKGVLVRVLTGTRHKGAMEAARIAYSQVCSTLLSKPSADIIHNHVDSILVKLEDGVQTSVTRRAAGLSMMVQAACGALPHQSSKLLENTISRLIEITRMKATAGQTTDSSPVLALHVLHALVMYSKLSYYTIQYLPEITTVCLVAFTSQSWPYRNAALQLYGAVVPRMVGQKKVKDDSSDLNCITAPEFLSRYPKLSALLFYLLLKSSRGIIHEEKLNEMLKESFLKITPETLNLIDGSFVDTNKSFSFQVSSTLIPVLSFLARLSPGTGLQQTELLMKQLKQYSDVVLELLAAPILSVRRLAAQVLVSLTSVDNTDNLVKRLISTIHVDNQANRHHGHLNGLCIIFEKYPHLQDDVCIKESLSSVLHLFLNKNYKCFENKTLAYRIALGCEVAVHKDPSNYNNFVEPGFAMYNNLLTKENLKYSSNVVENFETCILDKNQDISNAFTEYITFCLNSKDDFSEVLQKFISLMWNKLNTNDNLVKNSNCPNYFDIFILALERHLPKNLELTDHFYTNARYFLDGGHGMKIASLTMILVSKIILYTSVKLDFILHWSQILLQYSHPKISEDYRLNVSESLLISMSEVIEKFPLESINIKNNLILSAICLLQDEDEDIRTRMCQVASKVCNDNYIYHSQLSIENLINFLSMKCSSHQFEYLPVLWKLCCGNSLHLEEPIKSNLYVNSKSFLFVSHSINLYQEPKQLSILISKSLLSLPSDAYKQNMIFLSCWICNELKQLNEEGKHLWSLIDADTSLCNNKRLLMYFVKYMVSANTLVSLGNKIDVVVDVDYKFNFTPNYSELLVNR